MFDLGMSELLVIGIVALIVIGPKDLPGLFRSLGQFTGKMRGMAREFSRAMEAAADETGVKDVARDLKTATSAKSMGLEAVKDAASKFEKWDPLKNAAKPSMVLPKSHLQPDPQAVPPAEPSVAPSTAPAAGPPAPSPAMGPATQALATAKAERQAIAKDAAEKLKKTAAPAVAEAGAAPVKKPRAPRKPKSDQALPDKTPGADA